MLLVLGLAEAFPQGFQAQYAPLEARDEVAPPKQPEGYFQYVNVPAHKEYEFGWNKGNKNHYISRYEQSKDHRFRTRVRWGDSHGGYAEQYWEYNHGPAKKEPVYKEPVELAKPSYEPTNYVVA